MKICLIGGIYRKGGARKDYIKISPETVLEAGLRSAGHEVTALSHYDEGGFDAFDLVHVHHLSWGATRLAADPSRVPFIFTAHDATLMCGFDQPLSRRAAMRYVFSRADAAVALSDLEADFQRRAYRLNGAVQVTIPNGIDDSIYTFRRDNYAGQGRPWQLLFVGQLTPQKRVDVLLKALPLLPANLELSLVYQSTELENELRALVTALNLSERVHFLGRRDPSQLAELYHAGDLLVLPSAWEALPSVISEAMLCGLPFVATATGGIPEQANGFGQLLEKGDQTALAFAILHVMEHYAEFASKGGAMARHARERFAIPKMIERHLELYRSVATAAKAANAAPRRHSRGYSALNAAVRGGLKWNRNASVSRQEVAGGNSRSNPRTNP